MANPLPKHPQLRGNYAPINFEAVCQDLVIEGAVPEGLAGSLYRIGPNPKFVPDQGYHWFFGTGMVHAFHVHEGKIDYVNRVTVDKREVLCIALVKFHIGGIS